MKVRPRILVFAGSSRTGSIHRKLARAAAAALMGMGVEVTLADLRDYAMPLYDGDLEAAEGLPEAARRFRELVRSHEGMVIASPEYNGSFSALLKNTIDWVSRPDTGEPPVAVFRGKAAALIATSPGPGGGRRGLRHLQELLEMIGVQVVGTQAIPRYGEAVDSEGNLLRAEDREAMARLVEEVVAAAAAKTVAAA